MDKKHFGYLMKKLRDFDKIYVVVQQHTWFLSKAS